MSSKTPSQGKAKRTRTLVRASLEIARGSEESEAPNGAENTSMPYEQMSVKDLQAECKKRGMKGFWKERKVTLISRLNNDDEKSNLNSAKEEDVTSNPLPIGSDADDKKPPSAKRTGQVPQETPKAEPEEIVEPEGLNTPVIRVLKHLWDAEIGTEAAIDKLAELAKIAGTAAAVAILRKLLSDFLDRDWPPETQDYMLYELEIQNLAATYPETMEKPPVTPPVDPRKDDKMHEDPDTNEPDAGRAPAAAPVATASIDGGGGSLVIGLLGLAVAVIIAGALLAFALIWGDDDESSSEATTNVSLSGENPGTNMTGNTGSNQVSLGNTNSSSGGDFSIGCGNKDVGAVQGLIGLSVVCLGTEYDAYTWRSVPIEVDAICPEGWICTLHLKDDRIVVTETAGKYSIVAGTFRRKAGYPSSDAVHNACELLLKEKAFGASQTPRFDVVAHGFDCDGTKMTTSSSSGASGSTTCPSSASVVASSVGGSAANWEQIEVNGFKYGPGAPSASLRVPSGARIDYAGGSATSGSVTATEATVWYLSCTG